MIIFCKQCRNRIARTGREWTHRKGEPADGHAAQPLAARRCRLFDPEVVGLPGYDRVLARLVEREKAMGAPTEAWRVGLYVFDGKVRGVFRYVAEEGKVPPGSLFQPPAQPNRVLLRDHPVVKKRLEAHRPAR